MNFTGRIRLYLILVAVIPPLAILGAVWYESNAYNVNWRQSTVTRQVQTFSFVMAQREGIILQLMAETCKSYPWPILDMAAKFRRNTTPPPPLTALPPLASS